MPRVAYDDDLLEDDLEEIHFAHEPEEIDPLAPFLDDGTLTEVLGELKSGKEGTVFCCRPNPSLGVNLVAAKLFRSREERTFRNQAVYREGFVILNKRDERAYNKKTGWGRRVEQGTWMNHEYEVLRTLSRAGADVPKPLRMSERVLLMEYVGDESMAAPKLQEVELEREHAHDVFRQVVRNVELFLANELVHADLSAYNVLYWRDGPVVIDFPQAVDPRTNRNALALLERDLTNICRYFRRYGVEADPQRMARGLWARYMRAELR